MNNKIELNIESVNQVVKDFTNIMNSHIKSLDHKEKFVFCSYVLSVFIKDIILSLFDSDDVSEVVDTVVVDTFFDGLIFSTKRMIKKNKFEKK